MRVDSLEDALLDGLAKLPKSNNNLSNDADDSRDNAANLFSKPPRPPWRKRCGCTNSLLLPFADFQDGSRKRIAVTPNSKLSGRSSSESVKARSSMLLKPPLGSMGANCLLGVW